MKSYHVSKGAGLGGLTVKEHDIPASGPREVLVRVRANSLNQRELMVMQGTYPWPVRPDVIPVSDGVGEVVAVGEGVTRAKPGDRVAGAVLPYWTDGPFRWEYSKQLGGSVDGMLTEYALLPEEGIVHIPDHLSFEEAATLPLAALNVPPYAPVYSYYGTCNVPYYGYPPPPPYGPGGPPYYGYGYYGPPR